VTTMAIVLASMFATIFVVGIVDLLSTWRKP
jgi:hypothetical protein